ncbi:hypothetical protein AAMO2058_000604400 [Amorphochlora amoebiformis]
MLWVRRVGTRLTRGFATGNGPSRNKTSMTLSISNPALLLNNISNRYATLGRILMEYVDNAIDDKEQEYRENDGYLEDLELFVDLKRVNGALQRVTIQDNCRGMPYDKLMRLVKYIGESEKKLTPWLNGQFGFGMHAFRAAASDLWVKSRHGSDDTLILRVNRDSMEFEPPKATSEGLEHSSSTGTGTEVVLDGIDPAWSVNYNAQDVADEIEHHFERLLSRPGISIQVREFECEEDVEGNIPVKTFKCKAFDYDEVEGSDFVMESDKLKLHLKVSKKELEGQRARVFLLGRRINEIGQIQSFIRKSKHKQQLWSHPQLLGYVEVEGIEPVITRDEFKNNKARAKLYSELISLEDDIFKALQAELSKQRTVTYEAIEDVLGNALRLAVGKLGKLSSQRAQKFLNATDDLEHGTLLPQPVSLEEKVKDIKGEGKEDSPERSNDSEKKANDKNEKPKGRLPPVSIRLREFPESSSGIVRRYMRTGDLVEINVGHPDFLLRLKQKKGRIFFTDRLSGYLSNIVSASYNDHIYDKEGKEPTRDVVFDDLLKHSSKIEETLKKQIPALQRTIESIAKSERMMSEIEEIPDSDLVDDGTIIGSLEQ